MDAQTTYPTPPAAAITEFCDALSALRIPSPEFARTNPLEVAVTHADHVFRAAWIAMYLHYVETGDLGAEAARLVAWRDVNKLRYQEQGGTDSVPLTSYLKALGKVGERIVDSCEELEKGVSRAAKIAHDAFVIEKAFWLLECRSRGDDIAPSVFDNLSYLLRCQVSKDFLREALTMSPHEHWRAVGRGEPQISSPYDLIFEIGKLRLLSRSGWEYLGIRHESVAVHSLRAGQLAWILAAHDDESGVGPDPDTVLVELLVHDLHEARGGDLNAVAKKYVTIDDEGIIRDQLGGLEEFGKELLNLWHDIETRQSVEGKHAKDCDRLEMVVEALSLVRRGVEGARDWIVNTQPLIVTEPAKAVMREVVSRLEKLPYGSEQES